MYKILTLLIFLPLTLSQSWSQSFKCESHCSERLQEEGQFRWYTEGSWSLIPPFESQELGAKDPANVESPIQNANEGNKKLLVLLSSS